MGQQHGVEHCVYACAVYGFRVAEAAHAAAEAAWYHAAGVTETVSCLFECKQRLRGMERRRVACVQCNVLNASSRPCVPNAGHRLRHRLAWRKAKIRVLSETNVCATCVCGVTERRPNQRHQCAASLQQESLVARIPGKSPPGQVWLFCVTGAVLNLDSIVNPCRARNAIYIELKELLDPCHLGTHSTAAGHGPTLHLRPRAAGPTSAA